MKACTLALPSLVQAILPVYTVVILQHISRPDYFKRRSRCPPCQSFGLFRESLECTSLRHSCFYRCKGTKALLLMPSSPQTSMICADCKDNTHKLFCAVLLPSHTRTPFVNLCSRVSAFDYLTVFFTNSEHEPEWYWLRDTL